MTGKTAYSRERGAVPVEEVGRERLIKEFAHVIRAMAHRLAFRLRFKGRTLAVEVTRAEARYRLLDGEPLELAHHGEAFEVGPEAPVVRLLPPLVEPVIRPAQPTGRAPSRRGGADGAQPAAPRDGR